MKQFSLIAALFLFLQLPGFGQLVGCFTTENSAGQVDSVFCVGDTVFAINCFPNPNPTTTIWDFGTGLGYNPTPYFVYSAPGVYTIKQRGTPNAGGSYELIKTNYLTVVALPNPQFSVTACNSNQVFIQITDATYDTYTVLFGDGNSSVVTPGSSFIHAYNSSGTYTITVTGHDNESGCSGTTTFTVTTLAQLPTADLQKVEVLNAPFTSGSTEITFTTVAGYKYGIYFRPLSGGAFQQVGSFTAANTGISAFTHTPVNNVQQGCYRIETQDACNSASLPVSGEVCTLTLNVAAQNGQMQVTWQPYPTNLTPGFQQYALLRNNSQLTTLPAGTTTYTDQDVVCGRNYCYRIQAVTTSGALSVSNRSCAMAFSTTNPQPATLYASFSLFNTIGLTAIAPGNSSVSQVNASRSVNGGPFISLGTANGNQFTDYDTSAAYTSYCYQAIYADSCGNSSGNSNTACPVLLQGTLQTVPGTTTQEVQLSWTAYVGYQAGVKHYEIEILDEAYALLQTIPAISGLGYTHTNLPGSSAVLRYRIKAIPNLASEPAVYSNNIRFVQELSFAIPTAFTPNADNLNDLFEIKGGGFREFDLTIMSRTGQVVFQSGPNRRTWDGTQNGKPLPPDVYVFRFRATDSFGRPVTQTGSITLLR